MTFFFRNERSFAKEKGNRKHTAMKKKKYKKNIRLRIAAILLIVSLMTVPLWGCSDGKSNSPPAIRTEEKENAALPKSELLDTTAKVVAYVEEMVQAGVEEFSLVCSEEIYDILLKDTYKADGLGRKAYHSLLDQTGLYHYKAVTAGMKKTITVTDISLYPGHEIVRSIAAGEEEELSSELKKTLAEARSMADACRTSDALETAKNIQSTICAQVRYAYMTNRSHVDTAVGALLSGVADCDGYADAFYLVGSLAGLDVRCQYGIASSYDLEENKLNTASHMWNLLKLDGSWRVVDVCWADQEDGIDYTWFNIGKDRASRSRTWQENLSVPLLEATDLSTRPETEYSVTSREDLEAAIKKAIDKGQSSFTIIFDSNTYGSRNEAFNVLWNFYAGGFYYYWDECTRVLTITMDDNGDQ